MFIRVTEQSSRQKKQYPTLIRKKVRKRDEVKGERRKLHNEELRDLYSSSNIVWVIKSRLMSWAGHVARMGESRVV